MAALQGTILASKIVPTDSLDTYATHEDVYGRGGHRSVDTIVERDEISPERRKEGMTVYVKSTKVKYVLESGIDNANWKVDSSGGGSGGDVDLSDYYKKTETYNKAEVDTKIAEIPSADLTNYYNKTEVDNKIADIPETDLSNYYKKLETYSKAQIDVMISSGTTDLSDYYTRAQVDGLLDNISLDDYYDKTQTETLLSNKVDKVTGKGLSTNDFTDTLKQALELKKVQGISTDGVTKKLVVNYTDGTVANLNINDIVTDVHVSGATLDATTNVLTLTSTDGGADVTVDLSDFVNSGELTSALSGKADKIHSHSTSDITGLDATLSNKVTKNEAIIGDTKTKITYDSNGLVINGADLSTSDIPNLPQSKIINLETNLSSKIDKGVGVVGATKTKITYNNDGIITGGADLVEADLPNISQSKITNLVSDLSNKQSSLISGTNIKTINGESILGSGDIEITGGGSGGGYFTGTAGITVGGITTGDTFTGVPVTDMINNLINPELPPNLTNPNNVLTSTVSGLREIGTSITPRLTATFNRGSISPQYSASEPYRAGLPTKYVFTSTAGLNQEVETDATTYGIDVSSFEVALGTVTFSSNISYSAGPQPTTSKGNVFDNPLPAGTTGNKTVTITGVYPCYNGISTLTKMTLANHGGTITVDAPADMNVGGERFKIQYPTVWSAKTPVVQQENELSKAWDNQNMSDYSITTIDKNGVSYKQVEYIGAGIGARKLRLVF